MWQRIEKDYPDMDDASTERLELAVAELGFDCIAGEFLIELAEQEKRANAA